MSLTYAQMLRLADYISFVTAQRRRKGKRRKNALQKYVSKTGLCGRMFK